MLDGAAGSLAPDERSAVGAASGRRLALLATVGLVVVTVVVIVGLTSGPDPDEDASASTEPSEPGPAITMPTTLPPVATIAQEPAIVTAVPVVPAGDPLTSGSSIVTLPSRTVLIGDESVPPVDLATAIADLSVDRARRATTVVQWGDVPGTLEVAVTRDPVTDRDLVEYHSGAGHDVAIIDHRSATVFLGGDRVAATGDDWIVLTADQALAGTGVGSLRELADELLLGPLRPSALDRAMVEPAPWPELVADETTLAFDITLPTDELTAWVAYPLRPDVVGGPDDADERAAAPPETARLTAFVAVDGTLRQLTHRVRIDGVPQVFVHRLDDLADPVVVELPEFDPTDDAATWTWPARDLVVR